MKKISIIAPCYNEELNIIPFYNEISRIFANLENYDFQLIFADDGSTDKSVEIIKHLISTDFRVELVVNARNFGVYRNSFNALKYITGDLVIPMLPVDLQDPPNLIPKMIEEFNKGYEIVAGVRFERQENYLMKKTRRIYYKIVHMLADYNVPENVGEFQLISRRVADQLKLIDDYYPYTRGLIASLSANRSLVEYKWQSRNLGKTKHNLPKLIDQAINGIISSSTAPLRLMSIISVFIAIVGLLFGVIQVIAYFALSAASLNPGVSTAIVLSSLLLLWYSISIAVISEYLSAIHSQVRGRYRVFESGHFKNYE